MKKQHRFLVQTIPDSTPFIVSDPTLVHHMYSVLKLAPGESFRVFTPHSDDILVEIATITKKEVVCEKKEIIPAVQIPKKIIACIAITKRDSFELAVQKLTELGVHTIVPVLSDRTIKQSLRLDRLQKISDEALEQSGHAQRVMLSEPLSLEKALLSYSGIPSYYCETYLSQEPLSPTPEHCVFYIGPEGGWSDEEKKLFTTHGAQPLSLSATVLRAETAAIVAAAYLLWR
jgi:16S rRNA (uracil1498-N3)-methyltransferase